jgi:hypothetical protein
MADYRTSEHTTENGIHTMINLPLYAINQIRKECNDTEEI